MWEKNLTKSGYMYMYNWLTFQDTWDKHNIVNQIDSGKN